MVFHKTSLSLEPAQVKELIHGEAVKLEPANYSGDKEFYLTTAQVLKIKLSKENEQPYTLKLTLKQIEHLLQHGEGSTAILARHALASIFPQYVKA